MNTLYQLMKDEDGIETVEYGVMTALIVGTLVAVVVALTAAISGRFSIATAVINE